MKLSALPNRMGQLIRYFVKSRLAEVIVLQASPFLGLVIGGLEISARNLCEAFALMLASFFLTAHIFVFNDWVGQKTDLLDPRKNELVFSKWELRTKEVYAASIGLLLAALLILEFVSVHSLLIGMAIAILSLLYSLSSSFGKKAPIVGSLNHLIGGGLHFLLGYTFAHQFDLVGLLFSLFFGLIFAGGHLNQEIRDREGDKDNNLRTTAVVFGNKTAFVASTILFSLAWGLMLYFSISGTGSNYLIISLPLWIIHLYFAARMYKRGFSFDSAVWMQRRYRVLYGIMGTVIIIVLLV